MGGETAKDDLNERYENLERELLLLKVERDTLLQKFSESAEKLLMVSIHKENALKDLNTEVLRRKNIEGEVISRLLQLSLIVRNHSFPSILILRPKLRIGEPRLQSWYPNLLGFRTRYVVYLECLSLQ